MANLTEQNRWEDGIYRIETSDPVLGGEEGIANKAAKQLANRTKFLKGEVDTTKAKVDTINRERTGYAPKASPAFTGTPTAPTAAANTNNTQIATTAFVKNAIAALVGSAPTTLDTLEEISRALSGDANLKATLLAEIGKKANASDFNALHDLFIGIPIPYPLFAVPSGCLAMNGQRFDTRRYPKLAQKYPSGQLPDLRAEFIRGWDNGRNVDVGRALLSAQGDAIRNIVGRFGNGGSDNYGIFYHGTQNGVFRNEGSSELPWLGNGLSMTNKDRVNHVVFDASRVVPTASENRPRNIAFHYICLAA